MFSFIYVIVEYMKNGIQNGTYNLQIAMKFHTFLDFGSIYSPLIDCQVIPHIPYMQGGSEGGPGGPRNPQNTQK
jgi:hypothetical protein